MKHLQRKIQRVLKKEKNAKIQRSHLNVQKEEEDEAEESKQRGNSLQSVAVLVWGGFSRFSRFANQRKSVEFLFIQRFCIVEPILNLRNRFKVIRRLLILLDLSNHIRDLFPLREVNQVLQVVWISIFNEHQISEIHSCNQHQIEKKKKRRRSESSHFDQISGTIDSRELFRYFPFNYNQPTLSFQDPEFTQTMLITYRSFTDGTTVSSFEKSLSTMTLDT